MTTTKKNYLDDLNKIVIKQNKFSLIEAIDLLAQVYTWTDRESGLKCQRYQKQIKFKVNEKSKTGQATYFMDVDTALLIADDVINGTFKNTDYTGKGNGVFFGVGGISIYRQFAMKFQEGKYYFTIQEFKAAPPQKGKPTQKVGEALRNHSTIWKESDAREFFRMLKLHIETKYTFIAQNPIKLYVDLPIEGEENSPNLASNEPVLPNTPTEVQNGQKQAITEAKDNTLQDLFGDIEMGDMF